MRQPRHILSVSETQDQFRVHVNRAVLAYDKLDAGGRALFDAITGRDYAIVQGFTVIVAAGYVALLVAGAAVRPLS